MNMIKWLKRTLLRFLPAGAVHALRKAYYPGVVARFDESRWPLSRVVKSLVKRGDHVVDAGANIGYVTAMLARWVGTEGRVFSFEPVPETYDLLQHNMASLRLEQVKLFNCALSATDGEAVMSVPRYEAGYENPYEARIVGGGDVAPEDGRRVAVVMRRLDSALSGEGEAITFLKIDVEGHELDLLRGADALIERWHPAMVIEIGEDPVRARQLNALLRQKGYSCFLWSGEKLVQIGADDVLHGDCFFLTRGQYTACQRGLEGTARAG